MNALYFFSGLIRASWQASVLVAIVLAIQWIFRRRLAARWQYALWFLVLIRLMLPSLPSSAWSIYNCASRPIHLQATHSHNATSVKEIPTISLNQAVSSITAPTALNAQVLNEFPTEDDSPGPTAGYSAPPVAVTDWRRVAIFVWLSGVALLALRMIAQNLRFALRLRAAREVMEEEARELFKECKEAFGIRSLISLRTTPLVKSPALWGFLRPVLLLPEGLLAQLNKAQRRHVFLHELAHVKHRDMAVNWLATALGIVHWPNPVLWFAFRRMAMDRELASDELALSRSGEQENRAYGETIIRVLELCASSTELPGLIGILEGKRQMLRRLSMITRWRRQKRWSALAATLICAVALVTFTDAQPGKPQGQQTQIADKSPVENKARPDLIGHVQRADGQPANATVFIDSAGPKVGTSPFCPSCYADCRKRANTDSQGNFKVESLDPQLLFRILVVGDGYKPKFVSQVDPGSKPAEVTLDPLNLAEVSPEKIFHGRVLGANGAPVEGAAVETLGIHTKDSAMWGTIDGLDPLAVTDARGNFVITSGQTFTSLDLKVEARGFSRRIFTEVSGGQSSHDLQLTEGATLRGRLIMDGKPVTNAVVGAVSEDRSVQNFTGDFEAGTDAEGRFTFINLPPTVQYHVYGKMSALKSSGATPIVAVETGNDGSTTDAGDLKVGPGTRIRGWVVLEGHEIRPKTRLVVSLEDAWDSQLVELAKDGSFDVRGIPSGTVSISVDVPGARFSAKNASLDELNPFRLVGRVDHDITNLVVLLEHGAPLEPQPARYSNSSDLPELQGAEPATDHSHQRMISGRVTDAVTGEPIMNFHMTPGFSIFGDPDCDPSQAIDGENGAYAVYINKMARDPLLKIEARGYVPTITPALEPGSTNRDVTMTPGNPSEAALLGDPAGTRPSGFLIDLGRRPAEEQRESQESETLDKRRRPFFGKEEPATSKEVSIVPEDSEFIKYMSNPPWIRRMIFASWQMYVSANEPGDPETVRWQIETNLVAMQPSGFFDQNLTVQPSGFRAVLGEKNICGRFENTFWNAAPSFHQILYWHGTNITWGNNREARLQQIRHFGLPALRPNTFKLGENGEFSAETREGEALHGRFSRVADSHPLALDYTVGNRRNDVIQVKYRYDSTNNLPSQMEISTPFVFNNGRTTETIFAAITEIEYGIDPRISTGYRPTYFYSDMHAFARIQIFRDGKRFAVEPNGVQTIINR